jgi:glycosyltransferase involved in cell wall biosynthesis
MNINNNNKTTDKCESGLPSFSVIIPAYNAEKYIEKTLKSALRQDFNDYEIVIVNDGSTDRTAEILSTYHNTAGDIIRVIHQQNKGEGGARNTGIFNARGKYLAFLDQDDIWFPWTLKTYFQLLTKYNFPAFLVGSGKEFTAEASAATFQKVPIVEKYYDDFFSLARYPYLPTGTPGTVVRSGEARRVGGLSNARVVGIDQEFFYKLGDAKGLVFVSAPMTVAIRRHSGNLQNNIPMAAQGSLFVIGNEKANKYPGGPERAWDRRTLMTRFVRTISMQCLNSKYFAQGFEVYRKTFFWHLRLCRIKYLVGFPLAYLLKRALPRGK